MKGKYTSIKWLIFAALVVASVYVATPLKNKIRLGLDLAGGTSFTVQIDQEELRANLEAANEAETDPVKKMTEEQIDLKIADTMKNADSRTVEVIRNRIDGLGVNEPVIVPSKDHRIIIEIPGADESQRAAAEKSIKSAAYLQFRLVSPSSSRLVDELFSNNRAPDGFTITEANGRKYYIRTAEYETLLRDPGYKRRLSRFAVPDASVSFMLESEKLANGTTVYSPSFVRIKEEMNGDELDDAQIDQDPTTGEIGVSLTFTGKGASQFERITRDYAPNGRRNRGNNVGRQLAIVLDDTLYSAPVINEPIPSGRARISGHFTREDAAVLRNILNAGSLPAPIKILEKRTIDASLGRDAIDSGIRASIIGGALVILFMFFYYGFLGIVADIALVLNIVLLPLGAIIVSGFFGAIGANDAVSAARGSLQLPVLTMPGIAGIVLTIGMAVDANVLIYERIREEFKQGKSVGAAVSAGYDRAFYAIFDSNITTILTGVILFFFGSGPIRGFAVTLTAGIIVSMYTALVVTRLVINLCTRAESVKPFKMLDCFHFEKIDFLSKSRLAITTSLAVIILTVGLFAFRCATAPRNVMSIDFTGGTLMSYSFDKAPEIGKIRAALKTGGIDDAIIQTKADTDGKDSFEIKSGYAVVNGNQDIAKAMTETLEKAFPDSGVKEISQDTIGSQVGSDLKRAAVKAVLFALIGMIIYISIRFQFGFALGAIVALAHDVLVTLGLYTLFGRQIGITAIACFLTIVGYSVNDTIVIFDRIREQMRLDQHSDFTTLMNRSLNQTFSRTILTSVTTLLAVIALFVFGGGAINDFALCMLIGVLTGTYSSLFIATSVTKAWYKGQRPDRLAAKKRMA